MRFVALVFGLAMSFSANAGVVDVWKIKSSLVTDSYVTEAGGATTLIPRNQKVLVQLSLETEELYGSGGSRLIEGAKLVQGNGTARIQLKIENGMDHECRKNDEGGISFTLLARHVAQPRLSIAPGLYELFVNDAHIANLDVSEHDVNILSNPQYEASVAIQEEKVFADIFGPWYAVEIKGLNCSLTPGKNLGEFDFFFKGSSQTLDNGDILTKPDLSGVLNSRQVKMNGECGSNSIMISREIESEDGKSKLRYSASLDKSTRSVQSKSLSFQHIDRTCR